MPLDEREFADIPRQLALPEVMLVRKTEFHITLLSREEVDATARNLPPDLWEAVFRATAWHMDRSGELWLIRQEHLDASTRWSVIELLVVPALDSFRATLSELSGVLLAPMPPHVSLLVAGHERGIGLSSEAAFRELRVRQIVDRELELGHQHRHQGPG